jgi:hypothetical protein
MDIDDSSPLRRKDICIIHLYPFLRRFISCLSPIVTHTIVKPLLTCNLGRANEHTGRESDNGKEERKQSRHLWITISFLERL